jgi:hypothetical protein
VHSLLLSLRLPVIDVQMFLDETAGGGGRIPSTVTLAILAADGGPEWQGAALVDAAPAALHSLPLTPQPATVALHSARHLLSTAISAIGRFLRASPASASALRQAVADISVRSVLTAAVRSETKCFEELDAAVRSACGEEGLKAARKEEELMAYRHAVAALDHASTSSGADGCGAQVRQQATVLVQAAAQSLQNSLEWEHTCPLLSKCCHLLPLLDSLGAGNHIGDEALLKLLVSVVRCATSPFATRTHTQVPPPHLRKWA